MIRRSHDLIILGLQFRVGAPPIFGEDPGLPHELHILAKRLAAISELSGHLDLNYLSSTMDACRPF